MPEGCQVILCIFVVIFLQRGPRPLPMSSLPASMLFGGFLKEEITDRLAEKENTT